MTGQGFQYAGFHELSLLWYRPHNDFDVKEAVKLECVVCLGSHLCHQNIAHMCLKPWLPTRSAHGNYQPYVFCTISELFDEFSSFGVKMFELKRSNRPSPNSTMPNPRKDHPQSFELSWNDNIQYNIYRVGQGFKVYFGTLNAKP